MLLVSRVLLTVQIEGVIPVILDQDIDIGLSHDPSLNTGLATTTAPDEIILLLLRRVPILIDMRDALDGNFVSHFFPFTRGYSELRCRTLP
jgi:hypothetical protein